MAEILENPEKSGGWYSSSDFHLVPCHVSLSVLQADFIVSLHCETLFRQQSMMEFLEEVRNHLLEGHLEKSKRLYTSSKQRFLGDMLLLDGMPTNASGSFVTDIVAERLIPLHHVSVGRGETSTPVKYLLFFLIVYFYFSSMAP